MSFINGNWRFRPKKESKKRAEVWNKFTAKVFAAKLPHHVRSGLSRVMEFTFAVSFGVLLKRWKEVWSSFFFFFFSFPTANSIWNYFCLTDARFVLTQSPESCEEMELFWHTVQHLGYIKALRLCHFPPVCKMEALTWGHDNMIRMGSHSPFHPRGRCDKNIRKWLGG